MNEELKKKIDKVWLESDYGKWCQAIADSDTEKVNAISKQIFDSGYPMIEVLEDELASELSKLINSESVIDEYLQLLDKENSKLVGVIIQHELFEKVSKYIKG